MRTNLEVVEDPIAHAVRRERERRLWSEWPVEFESAHYRVFRCVCCERLRREEERREPESEVCVQCVREAGLE